MVRLFLIVAVLFVFFRLDLHSYVPKDILGAVGLAFLVGAGIWALAVMGSLIVGCTLIYFVFLKRY